jgi:hypothetical protein
LDEWRRRSVHGHGAAAACSLSSGADIVKKPSSIFLTIFVFVLLLLHFGGLEVIKSETDRPAALAAATAAAAAVLLIANSQLKGAIFETIDTRKQGCQMVYFRTKSPYLVIF